MRFLNSVGGFCFNPACLLSIPVLLTAFPAEAESNRNTRLFLPDPSVPILAHWDKEIVIGAVGSTDPEMALFAITQAVHWANWARTPAVYYKDIIGLETSSEPRVKKINYLIHFGVQGDTASTKSKTLTRNDVSSVADDLDQYVKDVLTQELQPISKGCFISRASGNENVLLANVISIDISLPINVQKTCLDFAILASLGIFPNIFEREFVVGKDQARVVVSDYSAPLVFLSSAGACIKEANNFDPQCALSIAGSILQSHGDGQR